MKAFLKYLLAGTMALPTLTVDAQLTLSLDSCRQMALRNNKQIGISRLKKEMARNMRKSARTQYLPRINAVGGYLFTSREISLLSDDQKQSLSNIGSNAMAGPKGELQQAAANMTADQKAALDQALGSFGTTTDQVFSQISGSFGNVAGLLNAKGQGLVDALRTDTRNIFAASVMLTQPIFMGGSIIAANKMAELGEVMADNSIDAKRQLTLYNIDHAYWTVVSLKHKKKLAESYLDLVKRLDEDVNKMIKEGVATRSDGLKVDVKVNEAEMTLTQVNDGLVLAKMLLCQLCGLDMNQQVTLADEDCENLATANDAAEGAALAADKDDSTAYERRPELRLLQNAVDMSKHATTLLKAGNLPKVALVGGYTVSNPNVFNSYEKKFGGVWNVGVMVSVPVWNWGDVAYKVRASKNATVIANMELDDVREKIELQVSQGHFKMGEANKKLQLASTSTQRAEENLRCATLGFREGVIPSTTVMEAQTAWLQAQSQRIDAEIDVKLSQVNLRKALGTLQE